MLIVRADEAWSRLRDEVRAAGKFPSYYAETVDNLRLDLAKALRRELSPARSKQCAVSAKRVAQQFSGTCPSSPLAFEAAEAVLQKLHVLLARD